MTWASQAAKHASTPVIIVSIAFNSGTRYYSNEYVHQHTATFGTFKFGERKFGGGIIYKGNILNLPQISQSIGDIKRTYERNKITLIFNDADYEFRGLEESETVSFKNRVVTIKLAFKDDYYVNRLTLFTGYVYDWKRLDGLKYEFDIEERSLNLENEYPDTRVTLTDYPNAAPAAFDSSSVGWIIPIPYGVISANGLSQDGAFGHPSLSAVGGSGTGLLFVDTTQDAEKHLVGIQATAITVDRVYKNGALQTEGAGNHYTITTATIDSKVHTRISWVAGVRPVETDYISCDITYGTRRPVEGIRHFLETFCGYTYATDFNATSYTAATALETTRGYDFAGAVWQRKTLRTILDEWRDEYELDIYWDKNGLICFDYMSYLTAADVASINHYRDTRDILEGFDSDPNVDKILNYLKYGYNYHYGKTYYYNYSYVENTASQTKYGATYRDFKGFQWIRTAAVGLDIANRKISRLKNPITFDIMRFPLKTFSDNLTDFIKITHFEGKGASGYSEKLFQIRKLDYNLDNYTNEMLLEDASAFYQEGFILGDEDVLPADWDAASPAEQYYGYLCDNTDDMFDNDIDPGKPLFG